MGNFAPSWEDILRRVHGHEQAPMQLSQMTRYQLCKGKADQSTKCKRERERARDATSTGITNSFELRAASVHHPTLK
jgi:hypothetical protein